MHILDKIVNYKKQEVLRAKEVKPISQFSQSAYYDATCLSMKEFLKREDKSGIIAEFKRKSPSKSNINLEASVKEVITGYQNAGVSGMSVLTDSNFFGGKNEDLIEAKKYSTCPMLRKDFIIDPYQIHEAKSIGADIILLIAEVLSKDQLKELAAEAKSIGLEVLMEIHSERQLEKLNNEVDIVGVNNRNLETFKVSIENSIQLVNLIPDSVLKISESGISNPESILKLKEVGYQGFLIGEHFMASANPASKCKNFINEINNTSQLDNIIVNP